MKTIFWAIEEDFLKGYLAQKRDFNYKSVSMDDVKIFHGLRSKTDDDHPPILDISGDTATISIDGVLRNRRPGFFSYLFGYGGTSYKDIIKSTQIISAQKAVVKNVKLSINSPGGEFLGVDETWESLFALRDDFNIVAENKGLMASGAYYLATAAKEITSSSATNQSGSIGVIVSGFDDSEMMKKMGVKEIVLVSKNAPDKFVDVSNEKDLQKVQARIDTIEDFFFQRIAQGRDLKVDFIKENFGRGGMLFSDAPNPEDPDAISVGMIDRVENNNLPDSSSASSSVNFKSSGANAQNKTEVCNMGLIEYLTQNPEAKTEFDKLLQEKYDSGISAGKTKAGEEFTTKMKSCQKFIGKDSKYPDEIKAIALEVASGVKNMETLEAVATIYEMSDEGKKSLAAKVEDEKLAETPGDPDLNDGSDGKITNKETFDASVERLKQFKRGQL